MHTLLVIDMQPIFTASMDPGLIKPITREISLAKKHGYPIIVVEYDCSGTPKLKKTHKYISFKVRRYGHFVKKDTDNGAYVVMPLIKNLTKSKRVRVIGVNTGACVSKTVNCLAKNGYKVEVVADGCWDTCGHNRQIRVFAKKKNVNVLRIRSGTSLKRINDLDIERDYDSAL